MSTKKLVRSTEDRWIAGVAAGIATYFDMDPLIIRVIWLILFMVTSGTAAALYGIMWFIMPLMGGNEAAVNAFDPEEIVVEDIT
ncbi:MAG: PspC domain-containing protein [Candidatus Promineifilaceae bacterium]